MATFEELLCHLVFYFARNWPHFISTLIRQALMESVNKNNIHKNATHIERCSFNKS